MLDCFIVEPEAELVGRLENASAVLSHELLEIVRGLLGLGVKLLLRRREQAPARATLGRLLLLAERGLSRADRLAQRHLAEGARLQRVARLCQAKVSRGRRDEALLGELLDALVAAVSGCCVRVERDACVPLLPRPLRSERPLSLFSSPRSSTDVLNGISSRRARHCRCLTLKLARVLHGAILLYEISKLGRLLLRRSSPQ